MHENRPAKLLSVGEVQFRQGLVGLGAVFATADLGIRDRLGLLGRV